MIGALFTGKSVFKRIKKLFYFFLLDKNVINDEELNDEDPATSKNIFPFKLIRERTAKTHAIIQNNWNKGH